MNYLAHLYLAGDNPDLIVGGFIADAVKGKQIETFNFLTLYILKNLRTIYGLS